MYAFESSFSCVQSTFFSVQMPQIPGVSVLLFVITYPFEEKMNAFPSSSPIPPSPLLFLFLFSHRLKAAVWVAKKLDCRDAGTQETLTEDWRVLSACVFSVMNHIHTEQ